MQIISIYDNETHSKNGYPLLIDVFFQRIKDGTYKDKVNEIRLLKYNFKLEEKRCENLTLEELKLDSKYQKAKSILKQKKGEIHRVTISGKFSNEGRSSANLISHSGLIDIDIDRIDDQIELEELKKNLSLDEYCVACFMSCGGDGLSFIARIDSSKIDESWEGLKDYFFSKYHVSIDTSHRNVANTRNASYDADIFINERKATIFKRYPKIKKKKELVNSYIHSNNDFEEIIREIVIRRLDFCPDYETYRNIGFAIGSQFGIEGLHYFNSVCQWNDKHNPKTLERDYKYFCKNPDKGIKIATFYAKCKEFNISTTSKKTSRIASVASASLKGGKNKEDTVKNLVKFENFTEEECKDIVDQVFDNKIDFQEDDSLLIEIETYIKHNYSLLKNSLTGKLENDGVEWTEEDLNGLYVSVKKVYDKADAKWIERVIFSPFIKSYNPVLDFFRDNKDKIPDELLDKDEIPSIILRLWSSIKTDNPKMLIKFGTKWLTSVIASAFGESSNLELDFTGKLNKGKSYFFKYLLPLELRKYFAETNLEKEKDDEILLCHKLIVLMDECGGKTRNDERKHKRLLEKDVFSLRRPYRKDNEDLKRLAVLCGTSNPQNLLTDAHGNRRIIPINVISRDFKMYDSIDKSELWMAVYYLWKQGFVWRIEENDINELTQSTLKFREYSTEYDLITRFYEKGEDLMTASDIMVIIHDKTQQKLSRTKIINELRELGFAEFNKNEDGVPKNMFGVKFKDSGAFKIIENHKISEAKKSDYF